VTILGRYKYASCDRIIAAFLITFKNLGSGLRKMKELPKQSNLREVLKIGLSILITAESAEATKN
jgi:hypothetical protein